MKKKKKPVNRNIPRNDTYRGISRQGLQNNYLYILGYKGKYKQTE